MKKIISMLLVLMLICTFCTPAFAADGDEPIELEIGPDGNVCIEDGKDYVISETCSINNLVIKNGTLTIAFHVDVGVRDSLYGEERAQINVIGVLHVAAFESCTPNCSFNVLCDGRIDDPMKKLKNVNYLGHDFHNGVCTVCDYACENLFHSGSCPDCGMVVNTTSTGSVLSQGYPEIVYGIGGIAIGVVATLLISRKKKVAVSATTDDEE